MPNFSSGIPLIIDGTEIVDTFAEAFDMVFIRMEITAVDTYWVDVATREFGGYGTSVIACDAEVGLERSLTPADTLDGRVGASVMAFGFSRDALGKAITKRTGQTLMTCPTTAVFDRLGESEKRIQLGKHLRFFGDGFQKSKLIGDRRFWRIPVMDGEFVVEESLGVQKGVAGGNFIIQTAKAESGLVAARRAVEAISREPGSITPFPGGVARSGSKVGSRYSGLLASTSETFCPTLRGRVESVLADGVHCAYEIVIDGEDFEAVSRAIQVGIRAACGPDVIAISAGNYGGKLGRHHFRLREILTADTSGD